MTTDIAKFYIMTPMEQHECMRTNIKNIPEEIIKEYELEKIECNGWACVEISKCACGLHQAGTLVNNFAERTA